MSTQPPRILFLMSDEHRADFAGFAGDRVAVTPTLDELARTGVVFDNCYTPSPICVPARQCLTSGQLPMTNGCTGWMDLPPDYMTFPRVFLHNGYETACCGKLHHIGMDQMQGWRLRPGGDMELGPSPRLIDGKPTHSPYALGADWGESDYGREVRIAGVGKGPWEARDEIALHAAHYVIDQLQFFGQAYYDWQTEAYQPLLLKFSLCNPHYPYFTSEEKLTYFLNRGRPFEDRQLFDHPVLGKPDAVLGQTHNIGQARRATACYYGMIQTMDEMYAEVMDHLRHRGEDLDDWLIVYTSDHGEMLGEHCLWEKQQFFEGSVRVPLIIRPPKSLRDQWGCEGKRVAENVNLCDLFRTLCDIAGVNVPGEAVNLDSRSLVPLMQGHTDDWHQRYRNETISQFFLGQRSREATPDQSHLMIKRDALKYLYYGCPDGQLAPEVLFDLDADPGETRNHIDDPQHADAVAAFRERRSALGFGPDANANYQDAGYNNPTGIQ